MKKIVVISLLLGCIGCFAAEQGDYVDSLDKNSLIAAIIKVDSSLNKKDLGSLDLSTLRRVLRSKLVVSSKPSINMGGQLQEPLQMRKKISVRPVRVNQQPEQPVAFVEEQPRFGANGAGILRVSSGEENDQELPAEPGVEVPIVPVAVAFEPAVIAEESVAPQVVEAPLFVQIMQAVKTDDFIALEQLKNQLKQRRRLSGYEAVALCAINVLDWNKEPFPFMNRFNEVLKNAAQGKATVQEIRDMLDYGKKDNTSSNSFYTLYENYSLFKPKKGISSVQKGVPVADKAAYYELAQILTGVYNEMASKYNALRNFTSNKEYQKFPLFRFESLQEYDFTVEKIMPK